MNSYYMGTWRTQLMRRCTTLHRVSRGGEMIGPCYWSTGISLSAHGSYGWTLSLDFFDDGFCEDDSTQGTLRGRYVFTSPARGLELIRVLRRDAEKLGITWRNMVGPTVYANPEESKPLQIMADGMARAIGWRAIYSEVEVPQ